MQTLPWIFPFNQGRGHYLIPPSPFFFYFVAGLIVLAGGILSAVIVSFFVSLSNKSDWPLVLMSVPIYLGYMFGFAYVQANISNLVWNHTRLGPLRIKSTLSGGGMAKLYFTNAVGILASLGLLTPWAVMRLEISRG